ncbi:MAG: tRNA pseudouridine(55) synthase TruB [Synergistaceae bacterium]|jgi:tRNA pseudouridine(55) synthase|nr:tRNA pseudouridine(55) synthase TruB [Synergistaceae bacterium]
MPNGFLLVDKPVGLRSAECVARVKRLLDKGNLDKDKRVGHAGTLDSTASGLLLVLLGTATRLSDYVMKLPKNYETTIRLGISTDTCDASGQAVFCGDAAKVDEHAFDRVLCSFWGTRMQRPPEISALKVNGRASHKMAREGQAPGLLSRPVAITSVTRRSPLANGRVEISVTCGKGTYIRALARDIGTALGCGAHVEELRRLSIGPFRSDACACDMEDAEKGHVERHIRPLREMGSSFHRFVLTDDAERRLANGLCVPLTEAGRYLPGTVELRHGLWVEGKKMIGFADIVKGDVLFLKPKANIADVFDGNVTGRDCMGADPRWREPGTERTEGGTG